MQVPYSADNRAACSHLRQADALAPLIRAHADEAEELRHLPAAVAHALAQAGLYRLAADRAIHGGEAPPATQIRVIETVARADGSAGWNLMIGIETFGLVAPGCKGRCEELLADPMTIMASSTAAVGRAERVAGGWRVSGQWQFVSGIHNAQVFAATVRLYDGDEPVEEGNRYAVVTAGDFEIIDTWRVSGLRGSGSHDVRLTKVVVPDERIIAHMGGVAASTPQLPLGSRLAYNKAAVALGIARAGVDAFVELAARKRPRFARGRLRERPFAGRALAHAEARLLGARAALLQLAERCWRALLANHDATREETLFHIVACDAARAAVEVVETLCEAAGTSANRVGEPLERIARDVRVVRQHATVAPHVLEDAGRALLELAATDSCAKAQADGATSEPTTSGG